MIELFEFFDNEKQNKKYITINQIPLASFDRVLLISLFSLFFSRVQKISVINYNVNANFVLFQSN